MLCEVQGAALFPGSCEEAGTGCGSCTQTITIYSHGRQIKPTFVSCPRHTVSHGQLHTNLVPLRHPNSEYKQILKP